MERKTSGHDNTNRHGPVTARWTDLDQGNRQRADMRQASFANGAVPAPPGRLPPVPKRYSPGSCGHQRGQGPARAAPDSESALRPRLTENQGHQIRAESTNARAAARGKLGPHSNHPPAAGRQATAASRWRSQAARAHSRPWEEASGKSVRNPRSLLTQQSTTRPTGPSWQC